MPIDLKDPIAYFAAAAVLTHSLAYLPCEERYECPTTKIVPVTLGTASIGPQTFAAVEAMQQVNAVAGPAIGVTPVKKPDWHQS